MIATQYIKSTNARPTAHKDYETINVLKWSNSKWKALCPYYLKTDGNEICANPGNVLFENFYQGLKVYPIVYDNEVYPSRYHVNNPKYLWWLYIPATKTGDVLVDDTNQLNKDLYLRWRTSLWSCPNPIRYPNKVQRRKQTKFSICIDNDGNETKMDYITARKKMYVKEYIRLVKKLPEYASLLVKLKAGKNIMLCELDVPAMGKKGLYGKNIDGNNICTTLTIEKLEALMSDDSEAFGHGLCLAYALLLDLML